ncbi:MAG: amino acid adenylation domain-containing protein [Phycisphaerae bacterium]|nr:amino acid adenylation domain-containing protein [Gemmatimonadaceae bacterium]
MEERPEMSGVTLDPTVSGQPAADAEHEPVMLPASFAQELLWFTDRASPGGVAYNVPRLRRLKGRLNIDALRKAFDALVDRHEVLRTTYATFEEQAVQVIHPTRNVPFDVIDLRPLAPDARDAEVIRVVRERRLRPFDLTQDTLMRVTLLQLDAEDFVLLFESHHVAFDGWSRDVVFRELTAFYEAFAGERAANLPALPIQYADYAIWQREELQGDRLESLLAFWRKELGDCEHVLQLPTDFPRPTSSRFEGVSVSTLLTPAIRDNIRALGQRYDATPYMVLLAAYTTVLQRYTGQSDVLVGSPSAGRSRPETHGLIGYFANTIVQRARFANNPTFAELLRSVRESALAAYDHQDVPFEKLVLDLEGRTSLGYSPLFQVVLTQLDSSAAPAARMGEVTLEGFALDTETTKFDLTLFMSDRPNGLELKLRGRADLHRTETVERLLAHVCQVLEAAVVNADAHVATMPLLSAPEREQLAGWNHTAVSEGAPATVVTLFDQQVTRVPTHVAVQCAAESLTYAQLNAQANQLARQLQSMGVKTGQPVGLLLDREIGAMVALLGILKCGAAYVPLSVDAPATRLAQQIDEAGIAVVVTIVSRAASLPNAVSTLCLDRDASALGAHATDNVSASFGNDQTAYVLFTSGSTGTPKGVAVSHANIVHYARAVSRVLGDVPANREGDGFASMDGWKFGLASTLAADLGNTSIFPALFSGGALHVLSKEVTTEPARFAEYMAANPLDVLKITPNHLVALAAGKHSGASLPGQWIVTGGEPLRPEVARILLGANKPRVLNHYGPTETTVGVCTFEVTASSLAEVEAYGAQTVPVGRPLPNTHAYVVDTHGNQQPIGVPGELLLGGEGVALGYFRRPELTAERFVTYRGERVYRTGDRVRRLVDGTIEFLGRNDDQVKVRGYRVELGDIEHMLSQHPGVAQNVVQLREDTPGDQKLVAYVVSRSGYAVSHTDRPTPESLREWLATALPEHMVPATVVLLDALPLTPNGKVDRKQLPKPDAAATAVAVAVDPRNETERQLATIWADVLKKSYVGITDNFFDLGGHSLLAVRVLGKISKTFGVRLSLRTLFDAPTVEQLAVAMGSPLRESEEPPLLVLQADGTETPVIFLHGDWTGAGWYVRRLAPLAAPNARFLVLPPLGDETDRTTWTLESIASRHIAEVRKVQPQGPYRVVGYCVNGMIAFEVATQLKAAGETVEQVVIVDSNPVNAPFAQFFPMINRLAQDDDYEKELNNRARLLRNLRIGRGHLQTFGSLDGRGRVRWTQRKITRLTQMLLGSKPDAPREASAVAPQSTAAEASAALADTTEVAAEHAVIRDTQRRALSAYMPQRYPGTVHIFWALGQAGGERRVPLDRWELVAEKVELTTFESTHLSLITKNLHMFAAALSRTFNS